MSDSPEVMEFMAIFAKVRAACEDDPGLLEVEALGPGNEGLRQLCEHLTGVAIGLQENERRQRELFASPVNPAFIQAWRDYEERYYWKMITISFFEILLPDEVQSRNPSLMDRWEHADEEAFEQAEGIRIAIGSAQLNAGQPNRRGEPREHFVDRIDEGVAAWERLREDTGFDLHGVFRRRALVPFVLVPRTVVARNAGAGALLNSLQQAHEAFVFGASFAAIALMRSILEAVLRDHYRIEGKNLRERIENAQGVLPPTVHPAALTRLRNYANKILHVDKEVTRLSESQLEREIVSLLYVLRNLIEGVG
jgi:hypothetical protein